MHRTWLGFVVVFGAGCANVPGAAPGTMPAAIEIVPAAVSVGQTFTVKLLAAARPGNTDIWPEDGSYRAQIEQVDVGVPGFGGWLTGEPVRFAPGQGGARVDLGTITVANGVGEASFKLEPAMGTSGRGIYVYVDSPRRLFGTGARVL